MSRADAKTKQRQAPEIDESARVDRIARLLVARPDLVPYATSTESLETATVGRNSLVHCLAHLNLFQKQVFDAIRALGSVSTEQLTEALWVDRAPVETAVAQLCDRRIVETNNGIHSAVGLNQLGLTYPANLGRTFARLARDTGVGTLQRALTLLGEKAPSSKQRCIEALSDLQSNRGLTAKILADSAPHVRDLAMRLVNGPPVVKTHTHHGDRKTLEATKWLELRAMVFSIDYWTYEMPRELAIAMRERLIDDVRPSAPIAKLSTGVGHEPADGLFAAAGIVGDILHLCAVIRQTTPAALNNNGVSAKDVKALGALLKHDEPTTARLLELAHVAGLIDIRMYERTSPGRGRGFRDFFVREFTTTQQHVSFSEKSLGQQWVHLVRAWLSSPRHLSDSGKRDENNKLINPLSDGARRPDITCQRAALLKGLVELPDFTNATPEQLEEFMQWHAPKLFVDSTAGLVGELIEEARILAVIAENCITDLGLRMAGGKFGDAATALDDKTHRLVDKIAIQPDGTVVASGTPNATLLTGLLAIATIEARDAAWIFRIEATSLRSAFDNGWTNESAVTFLEQHSEREIASSIRYLIDDAYRTHGNIVIGTASTFVRTNDEATLADIVRHKKMAKFKFDKISPTVAVCNDPQDKVMKALRDNSFMPVEHDSGATDTKTALPSASASFESLRHIHFIDADPKAAAVAAVTARTNPEQSGLAAFTELSDETMESAIQSYLSTVLAIDDRFKLAFEIGDTATDEFAIPMLAAELEDTSALVTVAVRSDNQVDLLLMTIDAADEFSIEASDLAGVTEYKIPYAAIMWMAEILIGDGS